MKRLIYTLFVAFWACVGTLVAVAALWGTPEQAPAQAAGDAALRAIPMSEVRRHASAEDCWMVIEGKVYRLEDYIPEHPTAPEVVTEWCGREATKPFRTKGYGRPHSRAAWNELEDYLVGRLAGQ